MQKESAQSDQPAGRKRNVSIPFSLLLWIVSFSWWENQMQVKRECCWPTCLHRGKLSIDQSCPHCPCSRGKCHSGTDRAVKIRKSFHNNFYLGQFCHKEVESPIVCSIRDQDCPERERCPDGFPWNRERHWLSSWQSCGNVVSFSRADTIGKIMLWCFYHMLVFVLPT